MTLTEAVIEGTLNADGTLELDKKPNLPAGRVTVLLRPVSGTGAPADDPFLQRLRAMWAIPVSSGIATDGGANTLLEIQKMREQWDERQEAIEGLQHQGRISRHPPEGPKP